jgi:hypothetical protein
MRNPDQNAKQRWWQVRCAMQPVSKGAQPERSKLPALHVTSSPRNEGLLTMVRIVSQKRRLLRGPGVYAREVAGGHREKAVTPTPNSPRRQRRRRFRSREIITYYATHPPLVVAHVGCAQAPSSSLVWCGVLNSAHMLFDRVSASTGHDVTLLTPPQRRLGSPQSALACRGTRGEVINHF